MATTPQFGATPQAPIRALGIIAFLLGIAHAGLAGFHWSNHTVTLAAFCFAVTASVILFLIAYSIAGRENVRDWNRIGLWFLLLSFLVLPVLVHSVRAFGVGPR